MTRDIPNPSSQGVLNDHIAMSSSRAMVTPSFTWRVHSARRALLAGAAATLLLGACTTVNVQPAPAIDWAAPWALLPIANHTETPQAGLRAEAILESIVRSNGVTDLRRYPASLVNETLFDAAERKAVEQASAWAKSERLRYGLTGTVDEWRYKVGVDGEPAVGITLKLIDLQSGAVVWTAAGSKTGWSREALSGVAQKLIRQLSTPLTPPRTR